jgi:hypothetical protein
VDYIHLNYITKLRTKKQTPVVYRVWYTKSIVVYPQLSQNRFPMDGALQGVLRHIIPSMATLLEGAVETFLNQLLKVFLSLFSKNSKLCCYKIETGWGRRPASDPFFQFSDVASWLASEEGFITKNENRYLELF